MTRFFSNQTISRFFACIVIIAFFQLIFAEAELTVKQIEVPDFKGTAKQLLDQINKDGDLIFAYSSGVSLDYQVSFEKQQMGLTAFLNILFKGKPIGYKVRQ